LLFPFDYVKSLRESSFVLLLRGSRRNRALSSAVRDLALKPDEVKALSLAAARVDLKSTTLPQRLQ